MKLHVRDLRSTGKTYRVYLDSEEVTHGCYNADEEEGFVDCYILRDGHPFLLAGKVAKGRFFGEVIIKETRPVAVISGENHYEKP